jgi:uncharacterized protein (TIGR04255 family)
LLYARAPIAEAIIDVHASFETAPSLRDLEILCQAYKDRLPLINVINSFALKLAANFSPDSPDAALQSNATTTQLGYRLSSANNDRVLQVRSLGMAYSHLPPYSDWETFLGEMRALWNSYSSALNVVSVTRLAVRFINRIPIATGTDVDEYVQLGPRIPVDVSKDFVGYFMQLVLPVNQLGPEFRTIVNTGVEPGTSPTVSALVLDIDVFCEKVIPIQSDQMWETLELLRAHKNRVFEASITDKVREMIK